MAKGKHAPAKGAVRKDKVIHPYSRKAAKLGSQEHRKLKLASTQKTGGIRLQQLGEKLLWFSDNLEAYLDVGDSTFTKETFQELIEGYLSRFEEELEQIEIKHSIGNAKHRRLQHASRKDVIDLTMKTEREEFEGCGLELPDLLEAKNLDYVRNWNGELRFVQNIKVRRFRKADLMPLPSEEVPSGAEQVSSTAEMET